MKFSNLTTELIYQDLKSKYNKSTITKPELAHEMSCSTSTIDLNISKGYGIPEYIKQGKAKNARVLFPIISVAEYLSQTIKTA